MIDHKKTIITVSACLLVGLASTAHADDHSKAMNVPFIETTEFMTGLENPWDMAFLPDGMASLIQVTISSAMVKLVYWVW